jgi:hypothetical protein
MVLLFCAFTKRGENNPVAIKVIASNCFIRILFIFIIVMM